MWSGLTIWRRTILLPCPVRTQCVFDFIIINHSSILFVATPIFLIYFLFAVILQCNCQRVLHCHWLQLNEKTHAVIFKLYAAFGIRAKMISITIFISLNVNNDQLLINKRCSCQLGSFLQPWTLHLVLLRTYCAFNGFSKTAQHMFLLNYNI